MGAKRTHQNKMRGSRGWRGGEEGRRKGVKGSVRKSKDEGRMEQRAEREEKVE